MSSQIENRKGDKKPDINRISLRRSDEMIDISVSPFWLATRIWYLPQSLAYDKSIYLHHVNIGVSDWYIDIAYYI